MPKDFVKDPEAILDYQWDWSAWLLTDTITGTPTITVPTGLTLSVQTNTTTTVTAFISGGTVGTTYTVECKIVTVGGRTDERSITIKIEER